MLAVSTLVVSCLLLDSQCKGEAYDTWYKAREYHYEPLPVLHREQSTEKNGHEQNE